MKKKIVNLGFILFLVASVSFYLGYQSSKTYRGKNVYDDDSYKKNSEYYENFDFQKWGMKKEETPEPGRYAEPKDFFRSGSVNPIAKNILENVIESENIYYYKTFLYEIQKLPSCSKEFVKFINFQHSNNLNAINKIKNTRLVTLEEAETVISVSDESVDEYLSSENDYLYRNSEEVNQFLKYILYMFLDDEDDFYDYLYRPDGVIIDDKGDCTFSIIKSRTPSSEDTSVDNERYDMYYFKIHEGEGDDDFYMIYYMEKNKGYIENYFNVMERALPEELD